MRRGRRRRTKVRQSNAQSERPIAQANASKTTTYVLRTRRATAITSRRSCSSQRHVDHLFPVGEHVHVGALDLHRAATQCGFLGRRKWRTWLPQHRPDSIAPTKGKKRTGFGKIRRLLLIHTHCECYNYLLMRIQNLSVRRLANATWCGLVSMNMYILTNHCTPDLLSLWLLLPFAKTNTRALPQRHVPSYIRAKTVF